MGSFDDWAHREIRRSKARKKRKNGINKKPEINNNLNPDQFTEEVQPVVEPEPPKMDEHGGELPERVPNDNGIGTKMEYPGLACSVEGCKARFFSFDKRDTHLTERHSN